VLEGCSWDEHTHAVAGDAEGLTALSSTIELAVVSRKPQAIRLHESAFAGFHQGDPRLTTIRVEQTTDLGPICFTVAGSELSIRGGAKMLTGLHKTLAGLAKQERRPGYSSPRYVPRWYRGNDFLQQDSDELSFLQLPIDPPLRA
jgi:hypothetical protein